MTDMFPPDEPYDPWEDKWDTWTYEKGYPENWQEQDLEIENPFGFPVANSIEDWHALVTDSSKEELLATYGMDNIYIIRELEGYGFWDADDWATWREGYEES